MTRDARTRWRRNPWRSGVVVVLVLALLATACSASDDGDGDASPEPEGTTIPEAQGDAVVTTSTDEGGVLTVSLSAGRAQADPGAGDDVTVVEGERLAEGRVRRLLNRLPAWDVPDEREDFARPAETLRPPVADSTNPSPFPAPGDDPAPETPSGPLEVLRVQPEGGVGIAPSVNITFNQPMVPLATLDQLDAIDVPVVMTPEVPGRWQWIGTRTLRFEHTSDLIDRLPMATEYRVEVPAGTTSEAGGVLAEAAVFEFSTPPPTVLNLVPQGESLPLEPIFFVSFDQRVDPAAVLDAVTLTAADEPRAVRLAADDEIAADEAVSDLVAQATEGRWVAFRPVEPLPADSPVVVELGPGLPSAEGPLTTESVQRHRGRTYAPLAVAATQCGYASLRCEPLEPLSIRMNNEIDAELFDPAQVSISPALPGAIIGLNGSEIVIQGPTKGRTTYEVTLDETLTDIFGQTLGADGTVAFEVDEARQQIFPLNRPFVTLDPLAEGQSLSVTTVNHDELAVRVFAVDVDQWDGFLDTVWGGDQSEGGRFPADEAWELLSDEVVPVEGDRDAITETAIDLRGALDGGPGQLVVVVESTEEFNPNSDEYWANRPIVAWVQATTLGIDGVADEDELVVRVTDLRDGAPVTGVDIEVTGIEGAVTTDADGIAAVDDLPTNPQLPRNGSQIIVARAGDEVAMLPSEYFGASWYGSVPTDQVRWYVNDDRGVYRPGETANLKGFVRRVALSGDGGLELFDGEPTVQWVAYDGQYVEIARGEAEVSALGGFDFAVELPDGANLGFGSIELSLKGANEGYWSHQLRIEEFRRPEFEVSARAESPGPYLRTEPATVAVEADYFAGGALPDTPVSWTVTTQRASYQPPNWDDFVFGIWQPWWLEGDVALGGAEFAGDVDFGGGFPTPEPLSVETFEGRTDATGTHFLQLDFGGEAVDEPTTVRAEAVVTDVNRQAFASATDLLVHPADRYVGLRSEHTFVRQGDPMEIAVIVTDIDGAAVAGVPVTVESARLEWRWENGEWSEVPVEVEECETTSEGEPVICTLVPEQGGTHRITAIVTDGAGRTNRTEMTRWVAGGDARPARDVEREQVLLVPDRETYAPGDTAEVLVQSPWPSGHGMATITRNGIVETRPFEIADGSAVLEIAITEDHVPGIGIQVDLAGATERTADDGSPLPDAPPRPAYGVGTIELSVPPTTRELNVETTPVDPATLPGADTAVDLVVTDAAGDPVEGAELAVVVVDEAVLALTGHAWADPLDVFYAALPTWLRSEYGRATIQLANPDLFGGADAGTDDSAGGDVSEEAPAEEEAAVAGGAAPAAPQPTPGPDSDSAYRPGLVEGSQGPDGAAPPIEVRSDFDALAVFEPEVTTAADGSARVAVPLPDNLTRYRVMVVAVDGADRFGAGEANITARLPLMVRPSAPRFLNFGDEFELPVVLQNQTDADLVVDVVVETANLRLTAGAGRSVTVPANDRIEVRFPAAVDAVGTARYRVAALSGDGADALADAATGEMPVYTPATAEAFATYGVLDDGAVLQPLLEPTGVFAQFGGLEVSTSSTALAALTDAVLYLAQYRYDSADAFASRIMAVAALRDVLEAFSAEGLPSAAELDSSVAFDIERLVALQNGDGGWATWQPGRPSEPWQSLQAVHALVLARDEGYDVPTQALERGLAYAAEIEAYIPPEYGEQVRNTLIAYALHVRSLAGDDDPTGALALWNRAGDELALDAVAFIWPVIDDAAVRDEIALLFANRVTETAQGATFSTGYGDDAYVLLHSDRRTDGIVLDALIRVDPDSDLIPKVVAGLLANQKQGRWDNVQENAFILLAMKRYFDTFENVEPDFVARVWLGDLYAAEHVYEGRAAEGTRTEIPMGELLLRGDTDLVIANEGEGRLYYRLGLRYAPDDLTLDPLDRGFVVQRTYEALDDPADVRRADDGTWIIRAGASVRVRLTMVADSRRTNMALIDPLPAGLETQAPGLVTTPEVPVEPLPGDDVIIEEGDGVAVEGAPAESAAIASDSWWWGPWWDHQNFRDDRAEAFSGYLEAGVYEFTYVARATTPGTFVVPPARAEEIYAPETFGRSAGDTVIVE